MRQLAESEYRGLQASSYLQDGLIDYTPVSQKVRLSLCTHESLSNVLANLVLVLGRRSLLVPNCMLHCAEHHTVCRAAYPAQDKWKLMLEQIHQWLFRRPLEAL